VAGNGACRYSGDGGLATNAGLEGPFGVAADSTGNLFIGDGSHIREVLVNGNIESLAGNRAQESPGSGAAIALDSRGSLFAGGGANVLTDLPWCR
jgi:hypothetical protein